MKHIINFFCLLQVSKEGIHTEGQKQKSLNCNTFTSTPHRMSWSVRFVDKYEGRICHT